MFVRPYQLVTAYQRLAMSQWKILMDNVDYDCVQLLAQFAKKVVEEELRSVRSSMCISMYRWYSGLRMDKNSDINKACHAIEKNATEVDDV